MKVKTLEEIQDEFQKRWVPKEDWVVSAEDIRFEGNNTLVTGNERLKLTDHALTQFIGRLRTLADLPASVMTTRYIKSCPTASKEFQINSWIDHYYSNEDNDDKKWKLRKNKGSNVVEAIVSKGYTAFDNNDLLDMLWAQYGDMKFNEFYVDNNRMELRYVRPDLKRGEDKSAVMAGWHLSNDEIGSGSIRAGFLIYQLVCANGMMGIRDYDDIYSQRHYGNFDSEDIRKDFAAAIGDFDENKAAENLERFTAMQGVDIDEDVDDVYQGVLQNFPKIGSDIVEIAKDNIAEYDRKLNKFSLISSLTEAIRDTRYGHRRVEAERNVGKLFGTKEITLKRGDETLKIQLEG
jgi:hypothetical protein